MEFRTWKGAMEGSDSARNAGREGELTDLERVDRQTAIATMSRCPVAQVAESSWLVAQ